MKNYKVTIRVGIAEYLRYKQGHIKLTINRTYSALVDEENGAYDIMADDEGNPVSLIPKEFCEVVL